MNEHNHQNKIAVINDFCGFGRCSMAVAMPIISEMRVQCCPLPTSIFSNHTGFSEFYFDDYTDNMPLYIDKWKNLELCFNGILTGFLGSKKQIEIVENFIKYFKNENTVVVIDPVMGDNGRKYATYTDELCNEMKNLVKYADILTPNLTEACILTDTPYTPDKFTNADYYRMAEKLSDSGACKIVITGIDMGNYLGNIIYEKGKKPSVYRQKKAGRTRSGTGDVFAAVIAADSVHNVDFSVSVRKASNFVKKCIINTEKYDIPATDGVCFEDILHTLK